MFVGIQKHCGSRLGEDLPGDKAVMRLACTVHKVRGDDVHMHDSLRCQKVDRVVEFRLGQTVIPVSGTS